MTAYTVYILSEKRFQHTITVMANDPDHAIVIALEECDFEVREAYCEDEAFYQ
jgi:hypothetical protein